MGNDIRVKICGLKEDRHVDAAIRAGANYLGFNFFEKSPRYVTVATAKNLMDRVPAGVARVALVVDGTDQQLDRLTGELGIDILQLHGTESPQRVSEIKTKYRLPVMKVIGVSDASDLKSLKLYEPVADQILLDAKPPKDAPLPGGNGLAFDWQLISGRRWPLPWMLAGGLKPGNVAEAIRRTGARQVDVSSGVETAPGQKSSDLITAFINAANPA